MRKDEVKNAIDTLIDLGLIVKFDDSLELYHGRVGKKGEEWSVDPNFSNAENSTGNLNVNSVDALNASDKETAENFANARTLVAIAQGENKNSIEPQVHRIVADGEAYIFAYKTIDPKDQQKVEDAMLTLLGTNLSRLSPVSYEDRMMGGRIYSVIKEYLSKSKQAILTAEATKEIARQLTSEENLRAMFSDINIPYLGDGGTLESHVKNLVYQIAGAVNTKYALLKNPAVVLDRYVLGDHETTDGLELWRVPVRQNVDGKDVTIKTFLPMSSAFVSSLLDSSNIVGYRQRIASVTVGRNIDSYFLFDKERINTEKVIGDKQRRIVEEYENLEALCKNIFAKSKKKNKDLFDVLENGTTEEIMDYVSSMKSLAPFYEKRSGVWEGFTIKEHTESVLRWFDTNYKNALPKNVETFMKICILSHDIGKGVAYENGIMQSEANRRYAPLAFDTLGLDKRLSRLGQYIIGDSQKKTTLYYIRRQEDAKKEFTAEAKSILGDYLGDDPTPEEIEGLWQLCSILQNCDSGSYTRRGITRKSTGYHKNANFQFTASFTRPAPNSGQRGGHLKEPGED